MNKIELLPKTIVFNDTYYQLGIWVTAWDRLCIGYKDIFNKNQAMYYLVSVCVEPENPPHAISGVVGNINEHIGNAVGVDDACEELLNWIEKNKEDIEIK